MQILKFVLTACTVISGIISGTCWVKAAYAKVPAGTQVVGSGFDGMMNVRNEKGEILDFVLTYELQSKWNSRAALSSASAALFFAVTFLLFGP